MKRLIELFVRITGKSVVLRSKGIVYTRNGRYLLKRNNEGFGGFERFELVSPADAGLIYGTVIKFNENDADYVGSSLSRPVVSSVCPFVAATALLS